MNDVKIYRCPIAEADRRARREAEREAASQLVVMALGAGAKIAHRDDGSPYVEGREDVFISISHCADECVLAVSCRPVGVDIETSRQQLTRIAGKFLTPAEAARGPHGLDSLLRYWTTKEAVFKCGDMPGLVISEIELTADLTRAHARGRTFTVEYHTPSPDKLMAVAFRDEG